MLGKGQNKINCKIKCYFGTKKHTKILSGKKYNGKKYEIIENNPYVKYKKFTSLV